MGEGLRCLNARAHLPAGLGSGGDFKDKVPPGAPGRVNNGFWLPGSWTRCWPSTAVSRLSSPAKRLFPS